MADTEFEKEEAIKELAYYRWLNAGCPESNDLELWLAAEDEFLLQQLTTVKKKDPEENYFRTLTTTPLVIDPDYKKMEEENWEITPPLYIPPDPPKKSLWSWLKNVWSK